MIPFELQFIGSIILGSFLLWVLRLIRQQRLTLRDSLLWLLSTVVALALTVSPSLMAALAKATAIQVPSNALFAAAIVYLSINVLSVTLVTSNNSARVVRLAQECALLRGELARVQALLPGTPAQPTRSA